MQPLPDRVYLDNAATSWPKPEVVYQAVDDYQRRLGAPAGRSPYREAAEVGRLVEETRKRAAEVLNAPHGRHIVYIASPLHLGLDLERPGSRAFRF